MNKNENNVVPQKQSKKEQAINKTATQAEKINLQVEQKREKHQPRDNA